MAVAAAAIALSHGTTLPGQTTPLQTPAGSRSITPNLTSGEDGRIWLSWIEPRDDAGHELRAAAHDGESWSPVRTIARAAELLEDGSPLRAEMIAEAEAWQAALVEELNDQQDDD